MRDLVGPRVKRWALSNVAIREYFDLSFWGADMPRGRLVTFRADMSGTLWPAITFIEDQMEETG